MASLSPDSSVMASNSGDGSSSSLKSNRLKFVIAIDYGTTCTGVAYGYRFSGSGEPIIQTVRAWPGDDDLIKVPSDIAYLIPRDNDKQRRFSWGTRVPGHQSATYKRDFEDFVTLKWVKLTLEDPKPEEFGKNLPSEAARKQMAEVPSGPFRPVDVISDYLTGLWEHVLRQIHRDLINLLSSEIQANMEKIVILTVPAGWSIHATRSMYNAAMKAGLDRGFQMRTELEAAAMKSNLAENFRLHIITEPEAAAMHILTSDYLKANDCIIVCDAGGGTVDLVSYEVKEARPLRLIQRTRPTGYPCGSTNLDTEFQAHLNAILSPEQRSRITPGSLFRIMRSWTQVKHSFDGKEEQFVDVESVFRNDYIDEKFKSIRYEKGLLTSVLSSLDAHSEKMKGLFNPVCNRVSSLIQEQRNKLHEVGKSAKAILMVGGLGCNEYLLTTLQERYAGDQYIPVLCPDKRSMLTSVCSGAVKIALDLELEPMLMSPFSFGLRFNKDGISWFILQGEPRNPGEPKTAIADIEIESANFSKNHIFKCDALISQQALPPRTSKGHNSIPVGVEQLASFEMKFPSSAHIDYPVQTKGDRMFKKIQLQLEFSYKLWCITIRYKLERDDLWNEKIIDYPAR